MKAAENHAKGFAGETKLFRRQGFEYDNVFDWTIREFQRLGLDSEEPPTSNSVDEKRGVD
jgi:hypothetical protein